MKTGIVATLTAAALMLAPATAGAASGDLDATFGTGGINSIDAGTYPADFDAAAVATDSGKTYVAGTVEQNFALIRLNADGGLDTGFGLNGLVTTNPIFAPETASDMVISGGKIVVAGSRNPGASAVAVIARFNLDGTLDTSFSGDGLAQAPISSQGVTGVAVDPGSGRIALSVQGTDFKALVFTGAGAVDGTFSGDGVATIAAGPGPNTRAVAFQTQGVNAGKVLIGGHITTSGFYLGRFETDGDPDSTFGSSGVASINPTGGADKLLAMAVDAADKIVATGPTNNGINSVTCRLDATGLGFDPAFAGGGCVTFPPGPSPQIEESHDVAVAPGGDIYVVGQALGIGGSGAAVQTISNAGISLASDTDAGGSAYAATEDVRIALGSGGAFTLAGNAIETDDVDTDGFAQRFTGVNVPDATFDTDGTTFPRPGQPKLPSGGYGYGNVQDAAPGPGGTYYVAGGWHPAAGENAFMLSRHLANGNLDPAFGTGGIASVTIPGAVGGATAQSLAVQPDGSIVLAGQSSDGELHAWVARFDDDGALDLDFDGPAGSGNGRFELDLGSNYERATKVAIDGSGRILVGGATNTNQDLFVARLLAATGALDADFGTGGKQVQTSFTGAEGTMTGLIPTGSGDRILVSGPTDSGPNSYTPLVYRLHDPAGAGNTTLDTTFGDGADGSLIVDLGGDAGYDGELALQPDGKAVFATSTVSTGFFRFTVGRVAADGTALDPAFSGDGFDVTPNFEPFDDYANDVELQADGSILTGGYTDTAGSLDYAIARHTPTGALDTNFSGDGQVSIEFDADSVSPFTALVASPADRVMVAGVVQDGTPAERLQLSRLEAFTPAPPTVDPPPSNPPVAKPPCPKGKKLKKVKGKKKCVKKKRKKKRR